MSETSLLRGAAERTEQHLRGADEHGPPQKKTRAHSGRVTPPEASPGGLTGTGPEVKTTNGAADAELEVAPPTPVG